MHITQGVLGDRVIQIAEILNLNCSHAICLKQIRQDFLVVAYLHTRIGVDNEGNLQGKIETILLLQVPGRDARKKKIISWWEKMQSLFPSPSYPSPILVILGLALAKPAQGLHLIAVRGQNNHPVGGSSIIF